MSELLVSAGPLINQSLSAAITIIAGSFLLYLLFQEPDNTVTRIYSLLLLFVLITYVGDLGVSYSTSDRSIERWLTFQWMGIAFAPAAYFHFAHAILTMTGLPSRGRRMAVVWLGYLAAVVIFALVAFTDLVVAEPVTEPAPHFLPGPLFILFGLYFIGSVLLSYWLLLRARQRTLTRTVRRRLDGLMLVFAAPALAVFPFMLVSGQALDSPVVFYALVIIAGAMLAVMLSYLSYSAAFLGSLIPERLIKSDMIAFFLRGPMVAIILLALIVWIPKAGNFFGIAGDLFMPFIVVFAVLFLQWATNLVLPALEQWLVYGEDKETIRRIKGFERRMITGNDLAQMLDAILGALCESLRIRSAFAVSLTNGAARMEGAIGLVAEQTEMLTEAAERLTAGNTAGDEVTVEGDFFAWQDYLLLPLYYQAGADQEPRIVGLLGMLAPELALEGERKELLLALAARAAEVLEDSRVQSEVVASIDGLLPRITTNQLIESSSYFDGGVLLTQPEGNFAADPAFRDLVKDALSHFWGGPDLTKDRLMSLAVVQKAMGENEQNPQRAMRAVLKNAIENLRPEGKRNMTTAEWIMYNILELRFIQGRKVRDVAMRLAMSEADFYRKQRVAIEAVSEIIADMESRVLAGEDVSLSDESPPLVE